jgi:hypothetical protein
MIYLAITAVIGAMSFYYWYSSRSAEQRLGSLAEWFTYDKYNTVAANIAQAENALELLYIYQKRTPDLVAYDELEVLQAWGFKYDTQLSIAANIVRLRAVIAALKR